MHIFSVGFMVALGVVQASMQQIGESSMIDFNMLPPEQAQANALQIQQTQQEIQRLTQQLQQLQQLQPQSTQQLQTGQSAVTATVGQASQLQLPGQTGQEGVQISQTPVSTATTASSAFPATSARTLTFTLPPNFSVSDNQMCQDYWNKVDSQLEDVIEEHPDSPYVKPLAELQKIVENIGIPTLIDAVDSTMGNKGVRTLVRETDKLKKRFLQLANRKAILDKHPEYQTLVEAFKQQQQVTDVSPVGQVCLVPAQLADFILQAIKIEDETETELVDFQEPVVHIVESIVTAVKQANKRRGKREPKGPVLEKQEVKQLEAFLKALKSVRRGGRGHHQGSGRFSEGMSGGSLTIIVVVIVVIIILIIIGAVFLLRKRQ